jgi:hypothetical protein
MRPPAAPSKSTVYRRIASWLAPRGWGDPLEIAADTQWVPVFDAAGYHYVTPALAWRLRDAKGVELAAADYLDAILTLNRDRNRQLRAGLALIGERLNALDCAPVLLKGSSILASGLHPDPGMRFMGDLDMLVPERQLFPARDALLAAGFEPRIDVEAEDPRHHQLAMMVHRDLGVGVELHRHAVGGNFNTVAPRDVVLDRALPVEVDGRAFRVPHPTDMFILAVGHGHVKEPRYARGVPALRTMLDMATISHRHGAALDWAEIERRFADAGAREALMHGVALAAGLMRVECPWELAEPSRRAMARLDTVLDAPPAHKLARALSRMARRVPGMLRRSPSEQLAALSLRRWRARFGQDNPRW